VGNKEYRERYALIAQILSDVRNSGKDVSNHRRVLNGKSIGVGLKEQHHFVDIITRVFASPGKPNVSTSSIV
jgi:hypothetical protein